MARRRQAAVSHRSPCRRPSRQNPVKRSSWLWPWMRPRQAGAKRCGSREPRGDFGCRRHRPRIGRPANPANSALSPRADGSHVRKRESRWPSSQPKGLWRWPSVARDCRLDPAPAEVGPGDGPRADGIRSSSPEARRSPAQSRGMSDPESPSEFSPMEREQLGPRRPKDLAGREPWQGRCRRTRPDASVRRDGGYRQHAMRRRRVLGCVRGPGLRLRPLARGPTRPEPTTVPSPCPRTTVRRSPALPCPRTSRDRLIFGAPLARHRAWRRMDHPFVRRLNLMRPDERVRVPQTKP